jgi:hypothetical protein
MALNRHYHTVGVRMAESKTEDTARREYTKPAIAWEEQIDVKALVAACGWGATDSECIGQGSALS